MGGERTVMKQRGEQEKTVHDGSAGTSMLPWVICQCFRGWSQAASAARGGAACARRRGRRLLRARPMIDG